MTGHGQDAWVMLHVDDVGLCHGANVAFRELSRLGRCDCGSVMVPCPWFLEAADMAAKESTVRAAAADVLATIATKDESIRRVNQYKKARTRVPGSITDDDFGAAVVTVEKYRQEEVSKKAAVVKAQEELSGAWTTLDLHVIRASIPGRIRSLYKQPGEAVKALDAVLQSKLRPYLLKLEQASELALFNSSDFQSCRKSRMTRETRRTDSNRVWNTSLTDSRMAGVVSKAMR